MGNINVLDFRIANLIAAGEVVDRPASVIKELMENAIDAGASHIIVEIQNGGTKLMRVSDDGCGMSREDVPVAIKRHATSKIHTEEDLNGIMTLGFRGEALAAIASVSRLRIMTKRTDDESGTLLVSEGGEVTEITEAGCRSGTTVIVEELFANVPARRKFLKRDASETMAVTAVVEKVALSRPDIAIRFISDNAVRFDTAGDGNLQNTIHAVLGREFSKKLIAIKGLTEGIEINGFICSPEFARGNRNYQNFFLNGRYIKSGCITAALEEAYDSYIASERFPSCVLNVIIHPAFVDVNVHPTKLEVKFSNEKLVFNAVYCAVRNALTERVSTPQMELKPTLMTGADVKIVNAFTSVVDHTAEEPEKKEQIPNLFHQPIPDPEETEAPPIPDVAPPPSAFDIMSLTVPDISIPPLENFTEQKKEAPLSPMPAVKEEKAVQEAALPKERSANLPYYRILGVAFHAYIFLELEDERVMIIDKHAAHERILFEQMKRTMRAGRDKSFSQILLIPPVLSLNGEEIATLQEYQEEIRSIGLDYVLDNEANTLSITAIPAELNEESASAMLYELAAKLANGTASVTVERDTFFEKALYQASCKAAMKAGRQDDDANVKWLCEELLRLPDIKFCPHGRPVAYELTKHEIERQFKRV